jgi:small subunit ribosomal protein S20
MPNTKSALKRMATSAKSRDRNLNVRTNLKTLRRALFEAEAAKNKEAAEKAYRVYCSALDKAAKKGIITRNTAIRRKARSTAKVKAISA